MAVQHEIHRVVSFRITGPYRLSVEFTDGLEREIDFSGVLAGSVGSRPTAPLTKPAKR